MNTFNGLRVFFAFFLLSPSLLWGAGFRCDSPHGLLRIAIYQHTHHLSGGTRSPAIMVLSNPKMPRGQRTIAVMRQDQGLLTYSNRTFSGKLDHRFNTVANAPNKWIGSYNRRDVSSIDVETHFNHNSPVSSGSLVRAYLKVHFKNGSVIKGPIQCKRYLKQNNYHPEKTGVCAKQLEFDF